MFPFIASSVSYASHGNRLKQWVPADFIRRELRPAKRCRDNPPQGYPSEPTSPPPLRRERDAKAVRREDGPGWAGDPGGRAASAGPSSAWGSR